MAMGSAEGHNGHLVGLWSLCISFFIIFNILCQEPPVFTTNVCHELECWHTTDTAFAVKMFAMRALLRATHCKLFAVSKPGFAVSIGLTAKP
jgi:hypothetical protein